MNEILKVFKSGGAAMKNEDPLTSYNMSQTQIPNENIKDVINKAVFNASKFASNCMNLNRQNEPK